MASKLGVEVVEEQGWVKEPLVGHRADLEARLDEYPAPLVAIENEETAKPSTPLPVGSTTSPPGWPVVPERDIRPNDDAFGRA